MGNIIHCSVCGAPIEMTPEIEKLAQKEYRRNFGRFAPKKKQKPVCDDCWKEYPELHR